LSPLVAETVVPDGQDVGMTSWQEFTLEVPDFATRVQARLQAFTHLTMATIRADGSPRISGNEIRIAGGHLFLAGMSGAWRWADLRRDPRVAIHSGSAEAIDPATWGGDAKLSGIARPVTDPAHLAAFRGREAQDPGEFELFTVEPTEVTWVGLNPGASALVIETWRPGSGVQHRER
jgi:hypothetical protein